jgi:hypothetical protein
MLRNASTINGYAIAASDGRLGTVSDFLFGDDSWLVRWSVIDTAKAFRSQSSSAALSLTAR